MTASLGGVDALVFTGGVGERAHEVRRRAVERLAFLGLGLDPVANAAADGDADVTAEGSTARVLVVAAREDVEIARGVRTALA
jgi:acetate kinase